MCFIFYCFCFTFLTRVRAYVGCTSPFSMCSVHTLHNRYREGNMRSGRKRKIVVLVFTKLSWNTIYFAIPRTEPNYQSGSLYCRRLGIWDPWIIWEYNIATTTKMLLLTHPHTCTMGYSIFTDMSWLILLITTRASFPRMTSTKKKIE